MANVATTTDKSPAVPTWPEGVFKRHWWLVSDKTYHLIAWPLLLLMLWLRLK